jgi:transketolase
MRAMLSDLIVQAALRDPRVIVLSGDHGYALFDDLRKRAPDQFVNVGIMEQAMVGIAAGLAKVGRRPIVYGLAAFIPVRVLEQIKLDICYSGLPVIFLGDGAGLVYSTLGASHQCAEDIACLRPLPAIQIYSPADARELKICFKEALGFHGPSYLRIGKSDRPIVAPVGLNSTEPYFVAKAAVGSSSQTKMFVATGSMLSIAQNIALKTGNPCLSIPKIKPLSQVVLQEISRCQQIDIFEEHSRFGGLTSAIVDGLLEQKMPVPAFQVFSLKAKFSETCGTYQHALSEHGISDEQLLAHYNKDAK